MWEDFINFYTCINFIITLLEHALVTFPNLLHFLDSWVVYKKQKGISLIGPKFTPLNSQILGPKNHELDCVSKVTKQHVDLQVGDKENVLTILELNRKKTTPQVNGICTINNKQERHMGK